MKTLIVLGGALMCTFGISACGGGSNHNYSLGGTVMGLSGSGLVIQNNEEDDLAVNSSGAFRFPDTVGAGGQFSVRIKTQPSNPEQMCSVSGGAGTFAHGDVASVTVACVDGPIALLAGQLGGGGNVDGHGQDSRMAAVQSIVSDDSGTVYIAESSSGLVRKISPAGDVVTLADLGPQSSPSAIALDRSGNVFVVANGKLQLIDLAAQVGNVYGPTASLSFDGVRGLAISASGEFFVADFSDAVVRRITAGGVSSIYAGQPGVRVSADGVGTSASFVGVVALAIDDQGNLFVADTQASVLRKITPDRIVTTLAGAAGQFGSADGTGAAARFRSPDSLAVDHSGNVYVADFANNTIRKVTSAGVVTTLAGLAGTQGTADAIGAAARFFTPRSVAADRAGNLYVADSGNYTVRKIDTSAGVTTIAGRAPSPGSQDGVGAAAQFNQPNGVASDPANNVYVFDAGNHTLRSVTPEGVVTTVAGVPGQVGNVDGVGAAARFGNITGGLAVDSSGNVYLADTSNRTIRRITAAGVVSTLKTPSGAPVEFAGPNAVAIDAQGTLYVSDFAAGVISKIDSTGAVTNIAGVPGSRRQIDGPQGVSEFENPKALAVDTAGNVYVADSSTNTIRKITPAGVVTTIAGLLNTAGSADGTGSEARFNRPTGLAVNAAGDIYVADSTSHTIRRISASGVVTTVAGGPNRYGVKLGALPGSLGSPQNIALMPGTAGRLVETDSENAVLAIALP